MEFPMMPIPNPVANAIWEGGFAPPGQYRVVTDEFQVKENGIFIPVPKNSIVTVKDDEITQVTITQVDGTTRTIRDFPVYVSMIDGPGKPLSKRLDGGRRLIKRSSKKNKKSKKTTRKNRRH
jgi:hypothetical protein